LFDSSNFKGAVQNPDDDMVFLWTAVYQNISKIFHDLHAENYREFRNGNDENKRLLLCDGAEGLVRKAPLSFWSAREDFRGTYE
jgi:hypothetical protein